MKPKQNVQRTGVEKTTKFKLNDGITNMRAELKS